MKKFEVGKTYLVHPHSLNSNLTINYQRPTTMVVTRRTESTIWCEIDANWKTKKETHRVLKVSKEQGEEAINCGFKDHGNPLYVWATNEIE